MGKLKYLAISIIVFSIFCTIGVEAASNNVLTGNSIFRKSATEASVNILSSEDGNIYYTVNSSPSATIVDITSGINAGAIASDITKSINIESALLSSGVKYIHLAVKDNSNNFSDTLTISMPKNLYYFDDFEAYNIDSYPSYFQLKYNGSNASNQKVIDLNGNNVFNGYGTFSVGLDERIQFPAISTEYAVLEADISASTLSNNYYYAGLVIGADYNTDARDIIVQINNSNNKFFYSDTPAGKTSNITFEANKNYHVKIVVDVGNDKFDYYVNGEKVNSTPLNIRSYESLNWFGIYNGSGTVYYDNIKFYTQSTNPDIYSITKGPETNGTFIVDKTSSIKDSVITVTPTPELGYRVKSVKINNSEEGITNNLTNYTFTMPEEDVLVTVEFEKIPFVVTINPVVGATISPTGTINVKYGDNKDIKVEANSGYRLKSVKVNDIEMLPLTENKITITNITENKEVVVEVEKIKYEVINGNNQKLTIGKNKDAVFKINADKNLFLKVYLNGQELNSIFYTVTAGSTVITLKQEFINNLLPGTYKLRTTFSDGGEANTTFIIEKQKDFIESNPKTGDQIIMSLLLASISLMGLLGTGYYIKKRKDIDSIALGGKK